MTTRKHNKRRSTGIMYELLLRQISCQLVEGAEDPDGPASRILRRHFKRGTELYREFRLFNALVHTKASSPEVAAVIVQEARNAAREMDPVQLDREKGALLAEVNRTFDRSSFYSRNVPEYRTYATIQTLLNDWRHPTADNLTRRAEFEGKIKEWLLQEKTQPNLDEVLDPEVDNLVVKLMGENINRKLGQMLSPAQADILRSYVLLSGDADQTRLENYLVHLKEEVLSSLDQYLTETKNQVLDEKADTVRRDVAALPTQQVDDAVVSQYLTLAHLRDTLIQRGG